MAASVWPVVAQIFSALLDVDFLDRVTELLKPHKDAADDARGAFGIFANKRDLEWSIQHHEAPPGGFLSNCTSDPMFFSTSSFWSRATWRPSSTLTRLRESMSRSSRGRILSGPLSSRPRENWARPISS